MASSQTATDELINDIIEKSAKSLWCFEENK